MKKYISVIFTMFVAFAVYAQSADIISDILESEKVSIGQVCYIAAVEQGLMSDKSGYREAVDALIDNDQLGEYVDDENEVIPVVNVAFIMSQIWDVKGGLMYMITKGSPRYAFKQFKADGIIASSVEPRDYISGPEFLSMYTSCSRVYGRFDIGSVSMENE